MEKKFTLTILAIALLLYTITVSANTYNITAGGLADAIPAGDKSTLTELTITGTVNAADFATMRNDLPLLVSIDLSGVTCDGDAIPDNAFQNKTSLISITFPSSITMIGNGAFYGCTSLTSVAIPNSVTYIGSNAFYNCTGLTSLLLPNNASSTFYGSGSFNGDASLATIYIYKFVPESLYFDIFSGVDKLNCILYVPNGRKPIYSGDLMWGTFANILEMPTQGMALDFDGVDDYVEIPDKDALDMTGDLTIEAWVNPKINGSQLGIVSKFHTAGANGYNLVVDNGVIKFNGISPSSYTLPLNVWTHIAGVVKGGVYHIYINGAEVPVAGTAQVLAANTDPVRIGCHGTTPGYFKGTIDEVRIWNRGLSQCEIQKFMNCEKSNGDASLLVNFHFNEGIPNLNNFPTTVVPDFSKYGNNGTLHSFALDGSTSNWTFPGAITSGNTCYEEISIIGNSANIPDNNLVISTDDYTDFGNVVLNVPKKHAFTISNPGSVALTINSITIQGTNADNFSISVNPASTTINPASSVNFEVTFTPKANVNENKTATIKIANTSCTHPDYTFAVGGYAVKETQTISLDLSGKTYGDAPFTLPATASSGLTVTYTSSNTSVATVSGNIVTIVGAGATTIKAAEAGNSVYQPLDAEQILTVSKKNQTITFDAFSNKKYGDASFNLSASASSGLAITYVSSDPTVATVTGNTVAILKTGVTIIYAKQAGNDNYYTAADQNQTLVVNKGNQTITFDLLSDKTCGDASFQLTATTNSGLPMVFSSSDDAIASVSGNVVTLGKGGLVVIRAYQAGNENYEEATVFRSFTVIRKTQTITFDAIGNKVYSDHSFNINASASSGLSVTLTSDNPAVAEINGSTVTIKAIGYANISVSQEGNDYYKPASTITQLVNVFKDNQTIAFAALPNKTASDAPFDLTATASSGLDVTFSSSNTAVATISGKTVTIAGGGTTTITAHQAGNGFFNADEATQVLNVNKLNQTINFSSLPSKTYGDAAFDLGATTSSGLAVTYSSSDQSVARVSGNTITIAGAGTTNIIASQAGNAIYNAAADVQQTLTINKADQIITFDALPRKKYGDPVFNVMASSSSGLPVYFVSSNTQVAMIDWSSGAITIYNPGTTVITAKSFGNGNYNAAADVTQTLTVDKIEQTITFDAIADKSAGDLPFDLNATASSGLQITYTSSNTSAATIVNNRVTIVGGGAVTITASQAGNDFYSSAADVSRTFTVAKWNQEMRFDPIGDKTYGDVNFTLYAYVNSGGPVVYSSSNPSVATISGDIVSIVGAGSTVITASQAGNAYFSSVEVSQTINVNKANQRISFDMPAYKAYWAPDYTLSASASTGLGVTFSSSNPSVASISGNTVHPVAIGTTVITVNQAGNANYNPVSVQQTLTIGKENQTITFNALPGKSYLDPDFNVNAIASSGLGVSFSSSNTAVATVSGNTIKIAGGGTTVITASQDGNTYYNAAPPVPQTLMVNKIAQTISFAPLNARTYGDASFSLPATASSGLAVSYVSANPSVASISDNMVYINGTGTTTITAKQAGDANYFAAVEVTQALTVNKADQTINFSALPVINTWKHFALSTNIASSGLPVTYSSSNTSIAEVNNYGNGPELATKAIEGSATITATQAGNANYNPASVSQMLTVEKLTQTITSNIPKYINLCDYNIGLESLVSSSSDRNIYYSSSNTNTAFFIPSLGMKLFTRSTGNTIITFVQYEDDTYKPASLSKTVTVTDLNIKNFDSFSFPLTGEWPLEVAGMDTIKSITGTNMPQGLSIVGKKLVANNVSPGLYKFILTAYDTSGLVCSSKAITLNIPNFDITGTDNLYKGKQYYFRPTNTLSANNYFWEFNGNKSDASQFSFSPDTAGNYTVKLYQKVLQYQYQVENDMRKFYAWVCRIKNYTVKTVPLAFSFPDEPLMEKTDYYCTISTNFKDYDISPSNYDLYINGTHVDNWQPRFKLQFPASGDAVIKLVVSGYKEGPFSSEITRKIYPKPSISILKSTKAIMGDSIKIPISITNPPPCNVTYAFKYYPKSLNISAHDSMISGICDEVGLHPFLLQMLSPSGTLLATSDVAEVDVDDWATINCLDTAFTTNKPYIFYGASSISDGSYAWDLSPSSSSDKTPRTKNAKFVFKYAGYYDVSLTCSRNNRSAFVNKRIYINRGNNYYLFPANVTDTVQIGYPVIFDFDMLGDWIEETKHFSLDENASNGATIDSRTGYLRWTPAELGTYKFTVYGETDSKSQKADYTFYVTVSDKKVATSYTVHLADSTVVPDVNIKIKEKYEYGPVEHRETLVNTFNLLTDKDGKAFYLKNGVKNYSIQLLPDIKYEYTLTHLNWAPIRSLHSFKSAETVDMLYDQKALQLADMTFVSGLMEFDATNQQYNLTNVTVNNSLFIYGKVVIKDPNGNLPTLITSGQMDIVQAEESVGDDGVYKEFYLSNGLFIPRDNNSWFNLGQVGGIETRAPMLSFSSDTIEFPGIPYLPWLLKSYMFSQGKSYNSGLIQMAKNEIPAAALKDVVQGIFDYRSAKELVNMYKTNTTKKMPTNWYGKGFRVFRAIKNTFNYPDIEVCKTYIDDKAYWDVSMSGLRIGSPSGFGLRNLDVIYKSSENYFECNGEISLMQDPLYAVNTRGGESLQNTDSTLISASDLGDLLKNDSTLSNVPVIVNDEAGNTIYSTTYDEFTDISGNIVNECQKRRVGLPINGFAVNFAIRDGIIDKIILTVKTNIPIPTLGLSISSITGGVYDLSKKDADGKVSYNNNFSIMANCDIMDLAQSGLFKAENVGVKITAWNYWEGSGTFKILNVPVGEGIISYDDSKSLFTGKVESNFSGFLKGSVGLSIGYDTKNQFDITGCGSYSVTTPDYSWIPSPFRDLTLGSFDAGFNRHRVAARVKIGLGAILRNEPKRSFVSFFEDLWENTKAICTLVGGKIVEIGRDLLQFLFEGEFGIGWDFDSNSFLFGANIDIPAITRSAQRGDTLIYSFEVKDDTRKMLILIDNGGKSEVQYQVMGPDNKLANDNIRMLFFAKSKTSVAEVDLPALGTWTVKVDTVKYGSVKIVTLLKNNAPSGTFMSPVVADTSKTQVAMKFNDTNDTLNVGVYLDSYKKGFKGKNISQFKVFDNATVKFDYSPVGLTPGTYYFYQTITDRSGIPVMNYAPGSLVITGSDKIPAPDGLKYQTASDSIIVYWNRTDSMLVMHTKVLVTDQFDDNTRFFDLNRDTFTIFEHLKPGHKYLIEAYNVGDSNLYSRRIALPEVTLLLTNGNNPPVIQNYKNKSYKFREGKLSSYSFKAADPEGDPVSYSLVEHFPKLMALYEDSLMWCPEEGDAGQYTFHLVVSDGTHKDTIPLNFAVDELSHRPVAVTFPSANLYEADNMFVSVKDEETDLPEVPLVLKNWRSQDSIMVNAVKTSEGNYVGNFQLSYIRRSVMPVKNGDTIVAIYRKDNKTYGSYAYFNETPQIKDHIPPSAITDLKVVDLNPDTLLLVFTVPSDKMDNGIITSPWVYDIRFSYTNLNSEGVFLKSLGFEEYEVGQYGKKDTVVILKKNLDGFDKHVAIWLNVKVGDTRFNYSDMSNTVSLNNVVSPQNVNASLAAIDNVNVKWEGPVVNPDSTFFQGYNVYRSYEGGDRKLIAHVTTNYFNDSSIANVEDGSIQYAVEGDYADQVTDPAYSNTLLLNRYTNVTVKLKVTQFYKDSLGSIQVSLLTDLKSSETKETVTDKSGYAYLSKTFIGTYTIEVKKGDKVLVSETENISDENNEFEYYLDSLSFVNPGNDISYNVFPNPSAGSFVLKMDRNTKPVRDVVIRGMDGKMLKPKATDMSNPEMIFIDLGTSSGGIYTITIYFEDKVVSKKLLIE